MFKFIYLYRTLLVLVILAIIVAIVTYGTRLLQGPMSSVEPNAADWISAISTFWGAVATGLGAFLTGGALVIAALSYRHQVEERVRVSEQHREEAIDKKETSKRRRRQQARNVSIARSGPVLELLNGSSQPITNVQLTCFDRFDRMLMKQVLHALVPGEVISMNVGSTAVEKAWAQFADAAGVVWRVHLNGDLDEV